MFKRKYDTIEQLNSELHKDCRVVVLSVFNKQFDSCKVPYAQYKCECGIIKEGRLSYLKSGAIKSCGCKRRNDTITRNTKWCNNSRTISGRYRSMISRCYDKRNPSYNWYGGRGVRVCDEWLNNYQSFIDWCNENGISKDKELDKDIKGDGFLYSPQTCCFVNKKINRSFQPKQKNGENSMMAKLDNKTALEIYNAVGTNKELSNLFNVPYSTVRNIKIGASWYKLTGHSRFIR